MLFRVANLLRVGSGGKGSPGCELILPIVRPERESKAE